MADEPLDQQIRDAVEPSPATVHRLVSAALRPAQRHAPGVGVMLATGMTVLLLVAALTVFRHEPTPIPVPAPQVRVTNVGDTIVVMQAEGNVWLIGREAADPDGLIAGTVIAYRPGER